MQKLLILRCVASLGMGVFTLSQASSSWALDPEVEALVQFETKSNAVSTRSNELIAIEHFEIPMDQLEQDISSRIPQDVRDSLIFERGGKKYVRWLINPEDTKWYKEVEKWLDSKKLSKTRHKHFKAYMTASRSYVIEDPITKAQFTSKVSTDHTGGAWRDKNLPIDDARQIRMVADFVQDELAQEKLANSIILNEPAMFGIPDINQAMLVRTLDGLTDADHYYLPGFSAVHGRTGELIAKKNGAANVAQFWNDNYNKPLARALAEFAARFGLTYDSPHSQNFLVELDKDLKPTGKIVLRDFGDTYATSDFFVAKGKTDFLAKWDSDNIINKELHMAVGVLHGNEMPDWLNDREYIAWGRDFFDEYEKELSKITGVPRSELQDRMYISGRYFSKNYSVSTAAWKKYISSLGAKAGKAKVPVAAATAQVVRKSQGSSQSPLIKGITDNLPVKDQVAAVKLLTKCMQQFKNMQVGDPNGLR